MTTDNQMLLPVADTLAAAWNKVGGSKAAFWAAIGVMVLILIGFGILMLLFKHVAVLYGVISIIAEIVNFLIQMGLIYIGIQRSYDIPINYRMMFRALDGNHAWKLIAYILIESLLMLPFIIIMIISAFLPFFLSALLYIICIIGLIILTVRLSMGFALILDKTTHPWEAIKLSFKMTRGNFWRIIALAILETIIIAVSMIPLLLGLIWTIPFGFILYGEMYKRLLPNLEQINQPTT